MQDRSGYLYMVTNPPTPMVVSALFAGDPKREGKRTDK